MIGTIKVLSRIAKEENVGIGVYLYPGGENLMLTVKDGRSRVDAAFPVGMVGEGTLAEGVLRAQAEDCVRQLRRKAEALRREAEDGGQNDGKDD